MQAEAPGPHPSRLALLAPQDEVRGSRDQPHRAGRFRDLAKAKPADELIREFSRMWGSYLGEVYRKNHGATWGRVTHGDQSFPGMKATFGSLFWPWGRVENRLRNGPEDNVWHTTI